MKRGNLLIKNLVAYTFGMLVIILSPFCLRAQDVSKAPLTWAVTNILDQNSQANLNYTCTFKTNGSQDILWLQKSGVFITTLSVQSVEGTWTDISTLGKIVYNVTSNDQNGILAFERTASQLLITLDLSQPSGNNLRYLLTASQVFLTN